MLYLHREAMFDMEELVLKGTLIHPLQVAIHRAYLT